MEDKGSLQETACVCTCVKMPTKAVHNCKGKCMGFRHMRSIEIAGSSEKNEVCNQKYKMCSS